tara:strand:- start:686 stop:1117 length:432 start_codon:yes stop_codon:yes gene_type:complete
MDTENNSNIVNNFEIEKICVDIENNDLESDKCVICLEPIIDSSLNNDLFVCTHAKNFHYDCVKTLNKCPLCRTNFNRNSSDYIIVSEPGCDCFKPFLCGIIFGGFFLWVLFLMICNPSLRICRGIYRFDSSSYNSSSFNSTSS